MYEDLIATIATLGVMGASLAVPVWLNVRERIALRQLSEVWRAWAELHGHRFVPGHDTVPAQVQGLVEQGLWTLDTLSFDPDGIISPAGGRRSRRAPHTVIAARSEDPVAGRVLVRNRTLHVADAALVGFRNMDLSDAAFDGVCEVFADNTWAAQRLLDARTRRALVALAPRPFVATCLDGAVWIRWLGRETDHALLDAAREAIVAACRPRRDLPAPTY